MLVPHLSRQVVFCFQYAMFFFKECSVHVWGQEALYLNWCTTPFDLSTSDFKTYRIGTTYFAQKMFKGPQRETNHINETEMIQSSSMDWYNKQE